MGSIAQELSLDLRASFVARTIEDFLRDVSAIGNVADKSSKLDDFVKRLEEEMKKIDAFKRELPLCMLLLNDAIVAVKEELSRCEAPKNAQPVLEEFIPLKKKDCDDEDEEGLNCNNKKEKDCRDKKNWMSSVQLWNTEEDIDTINVKQTSKKQTKINEKRHGLETEDLFQGCSRNRTAIGRAFVGFKPYSGFSAEARKEEKGDFPVHGLSLLTPGIKIPKDEPVCGGNRLSKSSRAISVSASASASASASSSHSNGQSNSRAGLGSGAVQHQQAARKQRRCWSPELHRRFVSALQQLGGSHVATPKQIRELMQVDGLTNDEVKSHLQKYRLHTRRVPSGSAAPTANAATTNQSVVVLGGLWMSQDQCGGESSKPSSSQSGSPQGPFQLGANGGGISSPTTGDESMEADEDAKSEGYSWKSHHSQTMELR